MGHDTSGMLGKERQQLEFLRRELDLDAGTRHTMAYRVDFEIADAQDGVSALRSIRWRNAVRMRARSSPTLRAC